MQIIWQPWEKLVNKAFIPLIHNKDRYLIMYGGRGSSKSAFETDRKIFQCLTHNYFRCILIRETYATIKDSQYQSLVDRIIQLGLVSLFEFKLQPLEIICKNGNKFLARGCDDVTKLKSIKDPTCAWYEEEIPSESDFITITTSIRTGKADFLQETFTINPEVKETDYHDNWFYKKFFSKHSEKTFTDEFISEIDGRELRLSYTVHFSDYNDNKWITDEFKVLLLNLKETNPYYYKIYCLGEWGNKSLGGEFLKRFRRETHVTQTTWTKGDAILLTFDENVNPYITCLVWQVRKTEDKKIYSQIDEICLPDPQNRLTYVCREFSRRYPLHHVPKLFIYGDRTSKKEDTKLEKGENFFTEIQKHLRDYKPVVMLPSANPSVIESGAFVDDILGGNIEGLEIEIGENCHKSIHDYAYAKEDSDGKILKKKVKHPDTGVSYEEFGHHIDALKYLITFAEQSEYQKNRHGSIIHKPMFARRQADSSKHY